MLESWKPPFGAAFVRMFIPRLLTETTPDVRIPLVSLEIVRFTEHPAHSAVTVQLALDGVLAHPFSVNKADLLQFPEGDERKAFFERSARTLIDVYGDARDGRKFSDQEVQERTAA